MVSKNKLQEELSSFNKQLDKHLQGVGVDMLNDLSFSSSSLPSEQTEQLILLTQSLKDIRMEMNLMRKHMSSDTETMLKSLMSAQQKQFHDEMRQFQEKTFSILKVFDPSQLKEITSEINRISLDQRELKEDLTSIKSNLESFTASKSNTSELDLKLLLEPYFMELSSKNEELESQIEHLFSREKNKFENFELILKDSLISLQKSIEAKQELAIKSIPSSKRELTQITKKLEKLDNLSKEMKSKVSNLDSDLSQTKKEVLDSSAQSENLLYKKLSSFEDRISNSEELQQNLIDKKISELDSELKQTKAEVLNSSAQSENLIYKKISSFENKLSNDVKSQEDLINSKISNLDKMFSNNTHNEDKIEIMSKKQEKVIDITSLATNENIQSRNTHSKLLDIDSRLKKLSFLKE